MALKETDLYPPLKLFLQGQGYEVKGEVNDCDLVAVRGDEEPVVIELKLSINLTLLLQAVDRVGITDHVYIAVPLGCGALKQKKKKVIKLLRMLGLGLIGIDLQGKKGFVEILLDPGDYQPKKNKTKKTRLLGEFNKRVGDPNLGGATTRQGRRTAYRQRAVQIAQYLQHKGECKAAAVAGDLGEPKARDILYRDYYGWFDGLGKGIYKLSPKGKDELALWA